MTENALVRTRQSLHAVAEQLLAGPQHRSNGSIKLEVSGAGFQTARMTGDPSLLAVRGSSLVAERPSGDVSVPLAGTLAELGEAIGVPAGPPEGVYDDGFDADSSFQVVVDEEALHQILQAYQWGDAALRSFAAEYSDQPLDPILWPEHFDVAIDLAEVNYGVSPGDSFITEPYAYVGPWKQRTGSFWNQPFGAAHPVRELGSEAAVRALFDEGRSAAAANPLA